jgi:TolB-like protein/Flp pilus assembly protein TadD
MARYDLLLSGVPKLLKEGFQQKIGRRKGLALVAYLALHEESIASEFLAELFWPNNRKNRACLRTVKSYLNATVSDTLIAKEGFSLRINSTVELSTDILKIRQLVEAYGKNPVIVQEDVSKLGLLESATQLWHGRFLSGFYLKGCPEFESWVLSEEHAVDRTMDYALLTLVKKYEDFGEYDKAILYARRRTDLELTNEEAHRDLMRLYAETGQRQAAMRQYHYCARILEEELGLEPGEETIALYDLLKSGGPPLPPTGIFQGKNKIAVLPLKNASNDPTQEFLGDGLSDDIRARLSQIHDLHVISRASTIRIKDTDKNIGVIGVELNARYILDGSMLRAGNDLRITVELVDVIGDRQLWSEKYSGTMADVFDIQEKICGSIIRTLKLKLSLEEQQRIMKKPIQNVHAFEIYLRSRPGIWAFDKNSLRNTEHLLLNALKAAGPNELLYATLGRVNIQFIEAGITTDTNIVRRAEEYVQKIFNQNPTSSYAYSLRGHIRYIRGEFQDAIWDLKRAYQVNPNDPETLMYLCYIFMLTGKVDAAKPFLERLLEVDPLTPINHCMPGFLQVMEGRPEAGLACFRKFYELDPVHPASLLFYSWALTLAGRIEESCELLDHLSAEKMQTPHIQASLLLKYALLGKKKRALQTVTKELVSTAKRVEYFSRLLTDCFALIDEREEALNWLENDIRLGFCNYTHLNIHNPCLANIRGEKRFHQLMEKVRYIWENFHV